MHESRETSETPAAQSGSRSAGEGFGRNPAAPLAGVEISSLPR
jgi:hypothetical protein